MSSPKVSTFFDPETHDVILLSADGLSFLLTKSSLSAQSSVFEGMFSLPAKDEEIQTVEMEEDGNTLELLRRYCLLRQSPALSSYSSVVALLSLCDKCMLQFVPFILLNQMFRFVGERPLKVWAYAAIYGADGLAKTTLLHFDAHPKSSSVPFMPSHIQCNPAPQRYEYQRPLSPSDLPVSLLSRVPASSLKNLLVCYDFVRSGKKWSEAIVHYKC
jgi:hypothetical protein